MYKSRYLFLGIIFSLGTAAIEWYGQQRGIVLIPYGVVVPLSLLLPRILFFSIAKIKNNYSKEWFIVVEKISLAFIALNAPASLWWHEQGFQYDRFLHFSVGALAVPLILVLFSLLLKPVQSNRSRTLWIVGAVSTVSLFCWELYQYIADQVFGTQLFHDATQTIQQDATEDIIFGFLGVLLALYILKKTYPRLVRIITKQ